MARTFYAYASFEDPRIAKALVLASIERWTWYWVLLEFNSLLFIATTIMLGFGAYNAAYISLGVLLVTIWLFSTYYDYCGELASQQISEIVDDAERANALKNEFTRIRDNP